MDQVLTQELLRVATVLNNLKSKGIIVERYNLTSAPQAFVDNKVVNKLLNSHGVDILPVIIVDGEVVKTKAYPTNEEFCKFLEVPEDYLKVTIKKAQRNMKPKKSCGCYGWMLLTNGRMCKHGESI